MKVLNGILVGRNVEEYIVKSIQNRGFNLFLKALLASLALISGGILYVLIRPTEVIFTRLISSNPLILSLKKLGNINQWLNSLPEWTVYSLPDGLWAFAYALLISTIWSGQVSSYKKVWMWSIPFLTIGIELLQLIDLFPGTFCIVDMCFITLGIITGYWLGRINLKNVNNENQP